MSEQAKLHAPTPPIAEEERYWPAVGDELGRTRHTDEEVLAHRKHREAERARRAGDVFTG